MDMENKWVCIEDEYGNQIIAKRLSKKEKNRIMLERILTFVGILGALIILIIGCTIR